jgi:hypothetical protein
LILLGSLTKKARYFIPGFFFVAKRFEISALELIRIMDRIIRLGVGLFTI